MGKKKISFDKISEMPEVAIAEGSMMVNKTGSWRYLRPIYREKLAPCRKGCPLGTDIPRVISLINQKEFEQAWELVVETNPMPAVSGHACYHSCENSCTRIALDDRVGVQALERFLADRFSDRDFPYQPDPKNGKKIAVVGAGPAGLAAAWILVRRGYQAEVFEKGREAGGMLRNSIPGYKLSRETLDRDLARLESFGIMLRLNSEIDGKDDLARLKGEYDAVIVATGTIPPEPELLPGESPPLVYKGLEFLEGVNAGSIETAGPEAVVIGTGNTAVDSARASRRLGASARVITLCGRQEMAATNEEIRAAEGEGVEFLYQAEIISARVDSGKILIEMKGIKTAEEGEDPPVGEDRFIPGSEFTIAADTLVEARGEVSSLTLLGDETADGKTVFTSGDAVTGPSSISHSMKSGISAAISAISSFEGAQPEDREMAAFNLMGMNRDCFAKAAGVELPVRELPEGFLDFSELTETISEEEAVYESSRCISCGVCNFCDSCMTFCPDFCIHRTEEGYQVDLDYCKGCGICSQECPRDVIDLIQEGS